VVVSGRYKIGDKRRTVRKLTEWPPCSRPEGRPRLRWLDQGDLKKMKDLKKMNVRNWREKCTDRRLWNEIVKGRNRKM
jgi:hypothetical protein